jgi:hypothetical protein
MKINRKKTEVMVCSKDPENINPLTPELNASCSGCLPEFFSEGFNFNACS